jgi:hypothetical protein
MFFFKALPPERSPPPAPELSSSLLFTLLSLSLIVPGYETLELNASDTRSKKAISEQVSEKSRVISK